MLRKGLASNKNPVKNYNDTLRLLNRYKKQVNKLDKQIKYVEQKLYNESINVYNVKMSIINGHKYGGLETKKIRSFITEDGAKKFIENNKTVYEKLIEKYHDKFKNNELRGWDEFGKLTYSKGKPCMIFINDARQLNLDDLE